MLNRRKKIQKIINSLKHKKQKIKLKKHFILQYKTQQNANDQVKLLPKQINQQDNLQIEEQFEQACWEDSDDDKLDIDNKNMFKKLNLKSDEITEKNYQGKLRKFYEKKYGMKNWAISGKGQQEKDINNYLNQQLYQFNTKKNNIEVEFHSRSHQCHKSVITGVDWKSNVLFSCGLDQKLKIWSVNSQQINPELKMKLEKDIYLQGLPLTTCYATSDQVYCGTLRKNIAIVNYEKWKVRYSTSAFLSKHNSYQNLQINKNNMNFSLFSQNHISLLDKNLSYIGGLQTNQQIMDICYYGENKLLAVSDSTFYEWDLRMNKVDYLSKVYLGFTKISIKNQQAAIGSKLGVVYIYDLPNQLTNFQLKPRSQVSNMVTHITSLHMENNLVLSLSKWKNNGGRVINVNQGRCIGKWPTNKTKINFPMVGKFNQNCRMMGIGSTNGYINIFKLIDK